MAKRTAPYFKGFASGASKNKLYDSDLVIQDLLNRIFTRKGERVMDPAFGSIIWDLIFELKSEFIVREIERDLRENIESDPRVRIEQLEIVEEEHGYIGNILIFINSLNITREFQIDFNNRIARVAEANQ